MDVGGDLMPDEPGQALEAVADDRRAEVADVHGLGNVGAAVVDDEVEWLGS